MTSQAKLLRDLMKSKPLVKVCGAYDSMSAKLVELAGFDVIWSGSFAVSASHGVPDASILTMTEFFDAAKKMVENCQIPVLADCDTGYGGPSNVRHMVKTYERAGIAGISIEDKMFPKQNSLLSNGKQDLLSEREFVGKILTAVDAKEDPDFVIIARIEALIAGSGMEEAIRRADAYEKAGADAIVIHSKQKTPDEVFEFADTWGGSLPLISIPTTYDSVTIDELISHQFKFAIYANQTLRVAHASITKMLKQMVDAKSMGEVNDQLSSMEDIFKIQKMFELKDQEIILEQKFKKLGY